MTETLLSIVPDYGLILVFAVVTLACMAAPLPASILVLTAGSFAATGDLSLQAVILTTFAAYVIGDQLAFGLARVAGARLIATFGSSRRVAPVLAKSEELLHQRGRLAVFLSHTIFSPTCAYVSYLSGAGGLSWRRYTIPALIGAMIWTAGYVGLGYVFATQIEQVAQLLSDFFGIILTIAVAVATMVLLKSRWVAARAAHRNPSLDLDDLPQSRQI